MKLSSIASTRSGWESTSLPKVWQPMQPGTSLEKEENRFAGATCLDNSGGKIALPPDKTYLNRVVCRCLPGGSLGGLGGGAVEHREKTKEEVLHKCISKLCVIPVYLVSLFANALAF